MTDCYAAGGSSEFKFNVYQKIESYRWAEYNEYGERLLEETGPIYGAGFTFSGKIPPKIKTAVHLMLKGKLEIFGGTVDYDGQTWGGDPVTSDVDYFGYRPELTVGPGFTIPRNSNISDGLFVQFGPFAGLGVKHWDRDINDTTYQESDDLYPTYVHGYTETWTCIYAPLGIRGDMVFPRHGIKGFIEFVAKIPLDNENTSDDVVEGEHVTIKPGEEVSYYFETGVAWQKSRFPGIRASFFYETLRFSQSDPVKVRMWDRYRYLSQPRSEADMYGLHIGVVF